MSEYIIKQIAAASVPNAPVGSFTLFLDTDGVWKKKDENGIVSSVGEAEAQDLESVLGFGNVMLDSQNIESQNGKVEINLAGDSFTAITGDFLSDPNVAVFSVGLDATILSFLKSDFTKTGVFGIYANDSGDLTAVGGNLPNYPSAISSQNVTIKQNVVNSTSNGGKDIIIKTDNTDYSNQIAYHKDNEDFELLVNHISPTADRTQSHQDKDGTIALTSDIPSQFNVDLDSSESTVTRVFAGGRTTFTITHDLGTLDLKPEVFRLSDGRTIGWRIERTGINTIEASRAGSVADGLFRILI